MDEETVAEPLLAKEYHAVELMATQSSVKEVVPEVGGSFSVDRAVVEGVYCQLL